jgi:hypothetical protein
MKKFFLPPVIVLLLMLLLIGCNQTPPEVPFTDNSPTDLIYNGTLGNSAYDTSKMPVFSHEPGIY